MLTILDPLYGDVTLDDFEQALMLLPEVQRLRYIRMCNINSLLITGASEPKRFEHTLGVVSLAKRWSSAQGLDREEHRHIVAAAALHDFQTPPFGHSLQYIYEDNAANFPGKFEHESIKHGQRHRYFQLSSANCAFSGKQFAQQELLGSSWSEVSDTINGSGKYSPLIAGDVDLDNIDNVIRLAYHSGLASKKDGRHVWDVISRIQLHESGKLSIPRSDIAFFNKWGEVRSSLYTYLLLNWAEYSAKAMLTRAIELAVINDQLGLEDWVLTDDELLQKLEHQIKHVPEISALARQLKLGDLLRPIGIYSSPDTDKYKDLCSFSKKREIERAFSMELFGKYRKESKIIFHPILDVGKTNRQLSLHIRETNSEKIIGKNSGRLLVGIFVSDGDVRAVASRITSGQLRHMLQEVCGVARAKVINEFCEIQQIGQYELLQ